MKKLVFLLFMSLALWGETHNFFQVDSLMGRPGKKIFIGSVSVALADTAADTICVVFENLVKPEQICLARQDFQIFDCQADSQKVIFLFVYPAFVWVPDPKLFVFNSPLRVLTFVRTEEVKVVPNSDSLFELKYLDNYFVIVREVIIKGGKK